MPRRAPSPCARPGCPEISHERYCADHRREIARDYDRHRGTSTQRGYGATWRRIRARVLAEEPVCRDCWKLGRVTPATEVDHLIPRRAGGTDARSNLQALCKPCHSRKTALEDGRWGS